MIEKPLDDETEETIRGLRLAYRGMHANLREEEADISQAENALRQRIRTLAEGARQDGERAGHMDALSLGRCRSMAPMESGMYRCTLDSGDGHTEHHYNFFRKLTDDERATYLPERVG